MKRCKKWYTQPITIRWSGENNPKKQIPEGGKIVPVKTNWATREIPPVKIFLLHVKKTGKTRKSGREKNFPRVKKMGKMGKNGFHGHFWFSRGKNKALESNKSCALRKIPKNMNLLKLGSFSKQIMYRCQYHGKCSQTCFKKKGFTQRCRLAG